MEGFRVKLNPHKNKARNIAKRAAIIWFAIFVFALSLSFDNVRQVLAEAGTTTSSVTVSNSAPTLSGVLLQQSNNTIPIVLLEATTKAVIVKGLISDINGDADISSATATIFRTSVAGAEGCTSSNANCYPILSGSCTLEATSGDNDRNVTCTANLQFFADRTDTSTETWTGFIMAKDAAGAVGSGTDTEEVNTLQALNVTASLAYGTLSISATTAVANNVLMQVTTTGNEAIDVTAQATNNMCDNAACTANRIRACQQQYSTNTATEYQDAGDSFAEAIELSSTTARNLNLESVTPTTAAYLNHDNTDDVFWKIGIPTGASAATFNGTTTITSKANANTTDDVNETLCN